MKIDLKTLATRGLFPKPQRAIWRPKSALLATAAAREISTARGAGTVAGKGK